MTALTALTALTAGNNFKFSFPSPDPASQPASQSAAHNNKSSEQHTWLRSDVSQDNYKLDLLSDQALSATQNQIKSPLH